MDRMMVYPGAIPLETDILTAERNTMIAIGYALQGYLGTGTYVDGFTCVQTTVPSQSVQVTPGQILTLANVDNAVFSSLPADTTQQIIKQGLSLNTQTFTCASPITAGQSVVYLVEAQQSDIDGTPVVLPYFNPSAPLVAWSGPAGAGTTNNTIRQSAAVVQVKTGIAATTGTQVAPTPDAGFTPMFTVTVAFGQTTITSTSIAVHPSAPFVTKLPAIPAAIQGSVWNYFEDTGSADALVIAPFPVINAYAKGQFWLVKKAATTNATTTPTININGLGTRAIKDRKGGALVPGDLPPSTELILFDDGTNVRMLGVVAADLGALHAQFNVVQVTNSTRTVLGPATTLQTFSTGTYTKKSATSNLIVSVSGLIYDGAIGANAGYAKLSATAFTLYALMAAATSTIGSPNGTAQQQFTGIAAGAINWTLAYGRNDATSWKSIVNPTSASDGTYLPPTNQTVITFSELEP